MAKSRSFQSWIAPLVWSCAGLGHWADAQDQSTPLVPDPPPAAVSLNADKQAANSQLGDGQITVPELQTHAAFLASDTLEGREAGTAGGQAAAAYLAAELRRLELRPLGSETDYRQPFGAGYQNVLGLIAGSDLDLREEWIVVGAHFDHVGFGRADNSQGPLGLVHNGADDNSSGVACLLEMAESLQHGPAPKRSVMIAFWDAEEKGLLGSEHWLSSHPQRQQLRFYINIDMVGRMHNNTAEVFGVRTLPGLRTVLAQSNTSALLCKYDWSQRNDSDHHTFYLRDIPYVMLFSGLHYDYHRPSDDVEKLNFQGIEKITTVLTHLTTQLANQPAPLLFRKESRYELTRTIPGTPLPTRMGVTWSPTRAPGENIVLAKVDPGRAADRAGLQSGDSLVSVNGQPVSEIADFIGWIRQCPNHLEVDYLRAADQSPARAILKLDGLPLPPGASAARDAAEPEIAVLTAIAAGSPAAQWGFRSEDRLHSVREPQANTERQWVLEREGRLMSLPATSAEPGR